MSGRERSLVLLLVLVVAPIGLWFLAAVPILEGRDRAVSRLAEARALQTWVDARNTEWQDADIVGAEPAAMPVGLSGLDRALDEAQLRDAASRFENAQGGKIAIRLEDADFSRVAPFLENLERALGYDIATLRLVRGESAGLVTVDLELEPER